MKDRQVQCVSSRHPTEKSNDQQGITADLKSLLWQPNICMVQISKANMCIWAYYSICSGRFSAQPRTQQRQIFNNLDALTPTLAFTHGNSGVQWISESSLRKESLPNKMTSPPNCCLNHSVIRKIGHSLMGNYSSNRLFSDMHSAQLGSEFLRSLSFPYALDTD